MDNILSKNSIGNSDVITVSNVRVLRPFEVKELVKAIPKKYAKTQFEALLYSGCRYVELMRLKEHPDMYEESNGRIHLNSYAIRKKKIKMKERYVILNPVGKRVIEAYLELDKELPDHNTWRANLKRWAQLANINDGRLSPKTTRKTWESWLVTTYPQLTNIIFLSQGHNALTALQHYVTLPFSQQDKQEMKEFVYGWEP